MSETPCLEVRELSKSFPTRAEPLQVLRSVTFELRQAEALAIMGPSGSGKSTILHIVGTLERPSGGTVRVDGNDPFELDEPKLAAFRNQHIGFVFQDHHLLPQCSVLENVLLPTVVGTEDAETVNARARTLLERVGLSERLEHRPSELSGGERQRAAIARALINEPKVLLSDEPTGNLDRASADTIGSLFLEVCSEQRATMVLVTHSLRLAEAFPLRMELRDGELHETV